MLLSSGLLEEQRDLLKPRPLKAFATAALLQLRDKRSAQQSLLLL